MNLSPNCDDQHPKRTFEDDIEYLALDEFMNDDLAFQDFCKTLQFDPYHPENESAELNRILGKKRKETDVPMTLAVFQNMPENQDNGSTSEEGSVPSDHEYTNASGTGFSSESSVHMSSLSSYDRPPAQKKQRPNPPEEFASFFVKKETKDPAAKPPKMKIPLKDIRRNYAHIFARAFNSCDKEIIKYCLEKYCVPECVCIYKQVGPTPKEAYVSDNIHIQGIEAILTFWDVVFLAIPDSVFEVEENKLRVFPNGSCSNLAKFIFFGTKIYHFTTDGDKSTVLFKQAEDHHDGEAHAEGDSASQQSSDGKIVSKAVSSAKLKSNSINESGNAETKEFGLSTSMERAYTMIVVGTFNIFINPEKKIYKFEFIHSLKQ